MDYDLKIVGGTIVDGSGAPGYAGDLGIKDGRIVALGDAPGAARETLDAEGRIVCPGFVDIHTHYDAQILWDRQMTISPWHGVTTVVVGNCGFGVAPTRPAHRDLMLRTLEKVEGMSLDALRAALGGDWGFESFPDYLDFVEARGSAINLAVLFGHTPLRTYVMGEEAVAREATEDEVAEMCRLTREAMAAGALGFATSHAVTHNGYDGHPVPSRLSALSEIDALAAAMAESGRGILQATVGKTLYFDQFADLARRHGVRISWTALLAGQTGPGSHVKPLNRTRSLAEEGLEIYPQVACRPLNFDFEFDSPFPFEMLPLFKPTMETDRAGRRAIYADPAFRRAFKDLETGRPNALTGWAGRTTISISPKDPSLEERPLAEIAAARGADPVDLALDLSLDSDFGARFRLAMFNYDEDEVAECLTHPDTVLGLSDAGAHASQLCDACFSTHLLGHWVREKSTLGLEQAVHMLTERPAKVFGITDRGLLAEGRPADVVLFDPDTVAAGRPRRVNDLPGGADRLVSDAVGIDAVVVNGSVLRADGADRIDPAGPLPGRLLRGGAAAA